MLEFFYWVWIIVLAFLSKAARIKFGFWANHYVLTNFYWALCLFISIFKNYYEHPVEDKIYYIFFIGNLFFNLTLFTSRIQKIPSSFPSTTYSLNKLRVLQIIAIAAVLPMAYENLKIILSGGELWKMYREYWENKESNSYLKEFISQNFVQPLSFVLMSTCMYVNFKNAKKYSSAITLSIGVLLAILNMLMTAGGRTGLMQFCFFIFLSYIAGIVLAKENVILKLSKKALIVIAIIGIGAFTFATLGRGGENVLDIIFERISLFPAVFEAYYQSGICDGYHWGLSMFETPVSFLLYPLKFLGFDVDFERISAIVSDDIWTPATSSFHNAAVSAYTFYMRDFGPFGVFIGPYIVGKLYNFLWQVCRKQTFLIVFYFSGVCVTCLDSTYPFARGYFFAIIIAFFVNNILVNKKS